MDTCVLGAKDVSAVEATMELLSWVLSPLKTDGDAVVDPLDKISFSGTVLTLSERAETESLSLCVSMLFCDRKELGVSCVRVLLRAIASLLLELISVPSGLFCPCTSLRTHPNRPRMWRLSCTSNTGC